MNPQTDLIDDLQLLDPPEPFRFQWWWVAAAAGAVLLLYLFLRWRRRARQERQNGAELRRAWMDALKDLEKLFALIDREESRPYAQESSAIIRRYIEGRFELSAPRQSTEEFLLTARRSPRLEERHQESLGEFLRICDLLKFARTLADQNELRNLHEAAVSFVKETYPHRHETEEDS